MVLTMTIRDSHRGNITRLPPPANPIGELRQLPAAVKFRQAMVFIINRAARYPLSCIIDAILIIDRAEDTDDETSFDGLVTTGHGAATSAKGRVPRKKKKRVHFAETGMDGEKTT